MGEMLIMTMIVLSLSLLSLLDKFTGNMVSFGIVV